MKITKIIYLSFFSLIIAQFSSAQQTKLDSLLFEALKNKKVEKIFELVEKGANIHARDRLGNTPLLLSHYEYAMGATLVAVSSPEEDSEIAKFLVEKGADVNAKNKFGETALFDASPGALEMIYFAKGNKKVDSKRMLKKYFRHGLLNKILKKQGR